MTTAPATFRVKTAHGALRGAATQEGLALLTFDGRDFDAQFVQLFGTGAERTDDPTHPAAVELAEYVSGSRREFTLPVDLRGVTAFRRRVLETLRAVPFGETLTYGDLARRAGTPGGARAVGGAVGANPVPIVIP